MKILLAILGISLLSFNAIAQSLNNTKLLLNEEAFECWTSLGNTQISNNGKYVFYRIINKPKGSSTLVVKSVDDKKEMEFIDANFGVFTTDNLQFIFQKGKDSLGIFNLNTFDCRYISDVLDFQLAGKNNNLWLVYREQKTQDVIVRKLREERQFTYKGVISYHLSQGSTVLFIQKHNNTEKSNNEIEALWIDVNNQFQSTIWKGEKILDIAFDKDDHQCAFITEDLYDGKTNRKIFIYKEGDTNAKEVVNQNMLDKKVNFRISPRELNFNLSSDKLFFTIEKVIPKPKIKTAIDVDIWNYKDIALQSLQLSTNMGRSKSNFNIAYNIRTNKLIELDKVGELVSMGKYINQYILIKEPENTLWFKDKEDHLSLSLVNTDNGSKKKIIDQSITSFQEAMISPDGEFVIWFDNNKLSWFSYEVKKGVIRNINAAIPNSLYDEEAFKIGRTGPWGIAGWIPSERSILLYDQFDIWKTSLDASKLPINISNGFGRSNSVTLNIIGNGKNMVIDSNDVILLSGYNRITKDGGYWQLQLGNRIKFDKRHLQPYSISSRKPIGNYHTAEGKIIKAKNANRYIVVRENAQKSPNVFFTKDLKSYKEISDIHPEENYNWITAELISWKMLDGRVSQGILYKPQNFNINKKYPLIFNYYEKKSDELHKFIKPEFSEDNINIPTFIEKGYLIFVPDIYSSQGHNGEGTYNAIESAAEYFCKLPYIDSTKLGLQGHSYGGWQTNYMITHSTRFAAACEAAGVCDQVSAYGQITYSFGEDRQSFYELSSQGSPYGFGVTPWTDSDLYINNSPVFRIDKIVTPLLMMHNKDDGAVPFEQAIEFFTGMRRAEKKVWLLQYNSGYGHGVNGKAATDYHMRMMQFFGYYLKGEPPPVWMTQGIPAYLKGAEDGLELDSTNAIP
jgi:dipeptidyl aminopeptidase/acylaminoacyl peptidase